MVSFGVCVWVHGVGEEFGGDTGILYCVWDLAGVFVFIGRKNGTV